MIDFLVMAAGLGTIIGCWIMVMRAILGGETLIDTDDDGN